MSLPSFSTLRSELEKIIERMASTAGGKPAATKSKTINVKAIHAVGGEGGGGGESEDK